MLLTLGISTLSINIVGTLSNFVIAVIEQLGYAGIFVGMTLESTGLPIPSEVIMPFARIRRLGGQAYACWYHPRRHARQPRQLTYSLLHWAVAGPSSSITANMCSYAKVSSTGQMDDSSSMVTAPFLLAGCSLSSARSSLSQRASST